MATTEEFLISLNIDPNSVRKFLGDVKVLKDEAKSTTVNIDVKSNAGEVAQSVTSNMTQLGETAVEATDNAQSSFASLSESIEAVQVSLVAATLAAAGFLAELKHLSSEGAKDEDALRQLRQAFGELSGEAEQFSNNFAEATGETVGTIQELLARTGQTAKSFGATNEEALKLSESLVDASKKIASAFGQDITAVFENLETSLFRGARAAAQYGISLDEAAIKEKALEKGLDPKNLSNAQERMLKLAIVLETVGKMSNQAGEGNKTFNQAMADLNKQISEVESSLGGLLNDAIKPLVQWLTPIVAGIKNWINANPRLSQTLLVVSAGIAGLVTTAGALLGSFALVTKLFGGLPAIFKSAQGAAVALGTRGLNIIGPVLNATAGQIGGLIGSLGTALPAVGAFTTALGVGAAALAGWEAGKAIDGILGISDSFVKVTKDGGDFFDKMKVGIAQFIFNMTGVSAIAKVFGVDLPGSMKIAADAAKQNEESYNRLMEQINGNAEAQQRYDDLIASGVPKWTAAFAAQDQLKTAYTLSAQAAKGNEEAQDRLNKMLEKSSELRQTLNADEGAASARRDALVISTDKLLEKDKELVKMLDEIGKGYDKVSEKRLTGEVNNQVKDVEDTTTKLLAKYRERARAIADIQKEIDIAQGNIDQGKGNQKTLDDLNKLNANMRDLAKQNVEIHQAMAAAIKISDDKVVESATNRVGKVQAAYDREVAAAKRATDSIINEQNRRIANIDKELNPLVASREKATEGLRSYTKEVQDASLREKDARLLEIKNAKDALVENLRGVASQEDRTAAVAAFQEQMTRVTKVTDDYKNAQKDAAEKVKDLARAQRELKDAANDVADAQKAVVTARLDVAKAPVDKRQEATDKLKDAEDKLTQAQQKQADMKDAVAKATQDAADAVKKEAKDKEAQAAVEKAANEAKALVLKTQADTNDTVKVQVERIKTLEDERLAALQKIQAAQEAYEASVKRSSDLLAVQIKAINDVANAQLAFNKALDTQRALETTPKGQVSNDVLQQSRNNTDAALNNLNDVIQKALTEGGLKSVLQPTVTQPIQDAIEKTGVEAKQTLDEAANKVKDAANNTQEFVQKTQDANEELNRMNTALKDTTQGQFSIKSMADNMNNVTALLQNTTNLFTETGRQVQNNLQNIGPAFETIRTNLADTTKVVQDVTTNLANIDTSVNPLGDAIDNLATTIGSKFDAVVNSINSNATKISEIEKRIKAAVIPDASLEGSGLPAQ